MNADKKEEADLPSDNPQAGGGGAEPPAETTTKNAPMNPEMEEMMKIAKKNTLRPLLLALHQEIMTGEPGEARDALLKSIEIPQEYSHPVNDIAGTDMKLHVMLITAPRDFIPETFVPSEAVQTLVLHEYEGLIRMADVVWYDYITKHPDILAALEAYKPEQNWRKLHPSESQTSLYWTETTETRVSLVAFYSNSIGQPVAPSTSGIYAKGIDLAYLFMGKVLQVPKQKKRKGRR